LNWRILIEAVRKDIIWDMEQGSDDESYAGEDGSLQLNARRH
jgi:hypothetical protein